MIPPSYADQVVEGSFEHALNEIVEEHLDLSVFDKRYAKYFTCLSVLAFAIACSHDASSGRASAPAFSSPAYALDYESLIHLDAEALAEGGIGEAYLALLSQLSRYIAEPLKIEEAIDAKAPRYNASRAFGQKAHNRPVRGSDPELHERYGGVTSSGAVSAPPFPSSGES